MAIAENVVTTQYDQLIGGTSVTALTANVTIKGTTAELKRGTLLGLVTLENKYAIVDNDLSDGSEKASVVLAEDVSLTGSDVVATVYTRGLFNREALIVKQSDDTAAAHEAELRAVGIYLTSIYGEEKGE